MNFYLWIEKFVKAALLTPDDTVTRWRGDGGTGRRGDAGTRRYGDTEIWRYSN